MNEIYELVQEFAEESGVTLGNITRERFLTFERAIEIHYYNNALKPIIAKVKKISNLQAGFIYTIELKVPIVNNKGRFSFSNCDDYTLYTASKVIDYDFM